MGVCVILLVTSLFGQVPQMMNYQGKLTDASGNPVPDGNYTMVFTIYRDSSGSVAIWSETHDSVEVTNGLFTVLMGSVNPVPRNAFGSIRFLGIQIPPEPELRPLMPIVSVGNAFYSIYSDTSVYSLHSAPDEDWEITGDTVYRLTGRVGIGASSPKGKLHVTPADSYGVYIDNAGYSAIRIGEQSRYGIYIDPVNWYGVRVKNAGFSGILIDTAGYNGIFLNYSDGDGVQVHRVDDNAFLVDTAGWYGFRVKYAQWDGIYVDKAVDDGITLWDVGDEGVYVINAGSSGFRVRNAQWVGFEVDTSNQYGVYVSKAGKTGLYVANADTFGVVVNSAGDAGVRVKNASNIGVEVDTADYGFYLKKANEDGIYIEEAYNAGVRIEGAFRGVEIDSCPYGIDIDHAFSYGIRAKCESGIGAMIQTKDPDEPVLTLRCADTIWGSQPIAEYEVVADGMLWVMFDFEDNGNAYASGGWFTVKENSKGNLETFSTIQSERQEIVAHGRGKLENGSANIRFSSSFSEFISDKEPIEITVTPIGSYSGLYISEKSRDGFVVKSGAGDPNCEFDWIAIGVEKGKETGLSQKTIARLRREYKKVEIEEFQSGEKQGRVNRKIERRGSGDAYMEIRRARDLLQEKSEPALIKTGLRR